MAMVRIFILSIFVSFFVFTKPSSSFSFTSFEKNSNFDESIALFGDASIATADSSIQITRASVPSSGRVVYKKPMNFLGPESPKIASFSTYFSFSISPGSDGIAFAVLPNRSPFDSSDRTLSVEFGASDAADSKNSTPARAVRIVDVSALNLVLDSGEKLHSWIDYDSGVERLEVRLSRSSVIRPFRPLVSYPMDLGGIQEGEMFVSISSASKNSTRISSLYSWSFRLRKSVQSLHSEPLDPRAFVESRRRPSGHRTRDYVFRILAALLFGVGCGAGVAVLVLFLWSVFVDRRPPLAVKECPVHAVDFEYEKIVTVAIKETDVGKK